MKVLIEKAIPGTISHDQITTEDALKHDRTATALVAWYGIASTPEET
jgi:hypothetical protein